MFKHTHPYTRREFLKGTTLGLAGLTLSTHLMADDIRSKRQFTISLACGLIGVNADARQALAFASQFGFESIEPPTSFLAKASDNEVQAYREELRAKNLVWGAAGVPVDFRGSETAFSQGMGSLPVYARALQRAGVTRVATWLSPGHGSLTYMANFRSHATRLREVARVFGDYGVRLGLEYVGPKTAWSSSRFPFIHTMAEMKDLIAEIGRDNVGFLLDSWHWYTAQETEADLLTLHNRDIVLCHLNDAPKGVAVTEQVDSRRELPCATGVIDAKSFLSALVKIGYDGPIACEPFSQELRKMPAEQAVSTVAAAMKKAVNLIEVG